MADFFFMPSMNIMGDGALAAAVAEIRNRRLRKALIVTDKVLHEKVGATKPLIEALDKIGVTYALYTDVTPNPTAAECDAGAKVYARETCDFLISFGGGSPHDCCKGIAIVATNGGSIKSYAGVDKMRVRMAPMFAVNTTSGTGSEITRFAIITDEENRSKFPVVDWRCTPDVSVDDPALMEGMTPGLTAATGMDALSHALEAIVSTIATPITDTCALKAAELINGSLINAYREGHSRSARSDMTYAEFLAGMAFNNASLGFIHAMSHQVGGTYHTLAHGVINSVLMPYVIEWNAPAAGKRYAIIARAMGVSDVSVTRTVQALVDRVLELNRAFGMPASLSAMGVEDRAVPHLASFALKDPCAATNPRPASQHEMEALFRRALRGDPVRISSFAIAAE